MGDGTLNKCKDCTKQDSKKRTDVLRLDNAFVESERKRGREKYRRLYVGKGKSNQNNNKKYNEKYPEKKMAKIACCRLKQPFYKAEKHHWSYNDEHFKDVIWLTKKEHMKGHRFIIYDQERKMYRRCDNFELLDTKEKHFDYIKYCIENKED